jgi:hypothetical protein
MRDKTAGSSNRRFYHLAGSGRLEATTGTEALTEVAYVAMAYRPKGAQKVIGFL